MLPTSEQVATVLKTPTATCPAAVRYISFLVDARDDVELMSHFLATIRGHDEYRWRNELSWLKDCRPGAHAVRSILELLEQSTGFDEDRVVLREIVANAPLAVLDECDSQIRASVGLGTSARRTIDFRRHLCGLPHDRLWQTILRECRKMDQPAAIEWKVIDVQSIERVAASILEQRELPESPGPEAEPEFSAFDCLCRAYAERSDNDFRNLVELICCDGGDVGHHLAATCALIAGYARIRSAVPGLVALLEHSDRRVADFAVVALGRIGDRATVPLLEARFGPTCGTFEELATEVLSRLVCQESEAAALRLLDRVKDPRAQSKLCDVLCSVFSTEAYEQGIRQLRIGSEDPQRLVDGMKACREVHGEPLSDTEVAALDQEAWNAPRTH